MSNVGTKSKQPSVHEINKNTKWSVENIDKFQSSDSTTGPLCQENKVLKIADFINYKNAFFVRNTLKRGKPQVFHEMFMLNQNHSHNTRAATCHILDFLQLKTTHFGRHSVKFQASETWNKLQRTQNLNLLTSAPSELKKKNCFRHVLPNTAITPRAIFHLLYIAILYFILFYFFMSLMSSLLVTHILDY